MYKKTIILLSLCILTSINVFSQSDKNTEKSILIYTEGQGYLQSYIETSIKNLVNVETEKPYFSSVNSFNRFVSDNKYKAQLSDLIRTQKDINESSSLYYSNDEKIIRKRIFDILSNYKYFLIVNTNTLGELIEFQFQLFQAIPSLGSTPYNISDNVIGNENFFINPKDDKCYSIIEQSLQRLFKQSNRIPEAELNIFGKVFKADKSDYEINLPLNTPIIFDGSNSGDFDNDNISYIWRNITQKDEKYQTSKKILFKQDIAKQEIIINDSGKYKIGFKVYDGVNYSNEIILNINSKEKLKKTILLDSIKYSVNYATMLSRKHKNTHTETYICEKLIDNDSLNKKIILTKTPISERYIDYIDESIIYKSYKFGYHFIPNLNYYFSEIEIESTLDNPKKKYNEFIYYLHDIDNEGLVYNERKIKHKLINRDLFSIGLRYEYITIENKEEKFKIDSPSFLINILLTNKIEMEWSIPYPNSETLPIENSNLKYPSFFNLSLRYFIIDINKNYVLDDFKPYLTFGLKFFEHINEPVKELNGSLVYCYVPGLGLEKTIKNYDVFGLSIRLNYQYGYFNDKYLKDYNLNSFSIDTIFRF